MFRTKKFRLIKKWTERAEHHELLAAQFMLDEKWEESDIAQAVADTLRLCVHELKRG